MKKLPIGISNLKEIIEQRYVYVDKTEIAFNLINSGKYYFLSRPRRFGKSLFLDTLDEIFQGNKELFENLYIYDMYEFTKYPIIRFSFNDGRMNSKDDLHRYIFELLDKNQRDLDVKCPENFTLSGCFKRLIEEAFKKYNKRVVILIDEYDKPILDNIENKEIARELREELKGFYSVIKGSDEYLKFVFLTGVSKFSKVSLFSGLNNLNDITIDKNYSTICGYTQSDIENKFKEHLKDQDFDKIKEWYNGYKWLGESVYNPFDILLFIQKGFVFDNYWFTTGTPAFLMKLIEKNDYFLPNLENLIVNKTMLDSFDIDDIKLEILLWQTGYLTIDEQFDFFDEVRYRLKIPNKEVKISLMSSVVEFLTKNSSIEYKDNIKLALFNENTDELFNSIKTLYAAIPYNLFTKNKMYKYEGYYVSVFYSYLKALGLEIIGEDVTNKGRIDITVILPKIIYIIEFKTDGKNSIEQIKEKKYHEKYIDRNKKIILLGIEFEKKQRNVVNIKSEEIVK
ncbi:MAG: ATP-binding protein [Candidatus Muirbacterium halophilum]|nr:ATP-binding protein [Candidatus Muirbacterium halophilum]